MSVQTAYWNTYPGFVSWSYASDRPLAVLRLDSITGFDVSLQSSGDWYLTIDVAGRDTTVMRSFPNKEACEEAARELLALMT